MSSDKEKSGVSALPVHLISEISVPVAGPKESRRANTTLDLRALLKLLANEQLYVADKAYAFRQIFNAWTRNGIEILHWFQFIFGQSVLMCLANRFC